jgi:hypothetical protein
LSICDADNLADYQSYLTSTHTNCLIQLLKSVSIKSFVSTEAAHLTAACVSVKLFSKSFSFLLNRLRLRSTYRLSSAGGEFYSVTNRCQPPFSPLPINPIEAANRTQPPPCQPGAFYSNSPSVQPFVFANFLIYKRFRQRPAPEKVRIIGPAKRTSRVDLGFIRHLVKYEQMPSFLPGIRA